MSTRSPGLPSACHRVGPASRGRGLAAFSLVEVLVAVTLLSVIVIGLLAMFHLTQKAFKESMTQSDILGGGRALVQMVVPEMEQIAASRGSNTLNLVVGQPTKPFGQLLPGGNTYRSNLMERVFFLTRVNQQWKAVDYQVVEEFPDAGVGTLYRYETNAPVTLVPQPAAFFTNNLASGVSRIADGLVHFQVHAFDTNGVMLDAPLSLTNVLVWLDPLSGEPNYQFRSNALPASIELEFGMLEPQTLEQFRGKAQNPTAAANFLAEQAGKVHLFRQRITLRNAPSAFSP